MSLIFELVIGRYQTPAESGRYQSEEERIRIADAVCAGKSARAIAAELGRAVSTVARELNRNRARDGAFHPHTVHAMMRARRPRPKPRRLERDGELGALVQRYLDKHWSPEQVAYEWTSSTAAASRTRRYTPGALLSEPGGCP